MNDKEIIARYFPESEMTRQDRSKEDAMLRTWRDALAEALQMLEAIPDDSFSPRDALKSAASFRGIAWGSDMGEFVVWAEQQIFNVRPQH